MVRRPCRNKVNLRECPSGGTTVVNDQQIERLGSVGFAADLTGQ